MSRIAILVSQSEIIPVGDIETHPENPRRGSVDTIVESMREHGQYRPVVVQRSTGYVLAGNHTLLAARKIGMPSIAVTYVDVSDAEARRIMLVDNRAADSGSYNNESLVSLLEMTEADFGGLVGTGYDTEDVASLLRHIDMTGHSLTTPENEWVGMPEFSGANLRAHDKVIINFANDEDADAFFLLIDRPRLRNMWWPQGDGHIGEDQAFVWESET